MLLQPLPRLNTMLKYKDSRLNKKNKISNMQRTSNLFSKRFKLMLIKLLPRRRKIKRKRNFSKQIKPKLEPNLPARLNSNKQELKNLKLILKLPRKRLSKWQKSKLHLLSSNSSSKERK
jgi:hypothetical protein